MENNDKVAALCGLYPVLKRVFARTGQFVSVLWQRPLKTRKGIDCVVTKEVRGTVRVGLSYDSRGAVQDARETGQLPSANAGLPWGNWLVFPYVIEHKGAHYVRLYPVAKADGSPRALKVRYRVNGRSVDRETAQSLCLASEFSKVDSDVGCMSLRATSLKRAR